MDKLRKCLSLLAAALLLFAAALPALANSAKPAWSAWLAVDVKNAPDDLEMLVKAKRTGETQYIEAKVVVKGTYLFERPSFDSDDIKLIVRTGGREYGYDITANMIRYGSQLRFSGGEPTLKEYTELKYYLPIAFACLGATLILEGLMLVLFGYRKLRTWIVFLITNIVTQAALHVLYLTDNLFVIYFTGLLLFELAVIVVEAVVYCLFFREHSRGRAVGYAITANIVSAILGTLIVLILFWGK